LHQYLTDIGLKTVSRVHQAIVHLSGGQVLGLAFGMPVVELHTVGRRSGRPRSTMLTAPVVDGERVVLVASKGGDDRDPDWYRNLIADPDIELTMAGRRRPMRARRASPERRRSCGLRWWRPTRATSVTSAVPSATSRWSSASRAERLPWLASAIPACGFTSQYCAVWTDWRQISRRHALYPVLGFLRGPERRYARLPSFEAPSTMQRRSGHSDGQ
jgi:deazaflavin-dependent oxidoreductase (nitroreductase family)